MEMHAEGLWWEWKSGRRKSRHSWEVERAGLNKKWRLGSKVGEDTWAWSSWEAPHLA